MWDEIVVVLLALLVFYLGVRWLSNRGNIDKAEADAIMYESTAELTEIRDNLRNQLWGDD